MRHKKFAQNYFKDEEFDYKDAFSSVKEKLKSTFFNSATIKSRVKVTKEKKSTNWSKEVVFTRAPTTTESWQVL